MSYSQLMDVMLRSHLYILFSVNTNKRWTNIQQKISKQNERWDGSVHTKTYGATIKLIEIYQTLAKNYQTTPSIQAACGTCNCIVDITVSSKNDTSSQ